MLKMFIFVGSKLQRIQQDLKSHQFLLPADSNGNLGSDDQFPVEQITHNPVKTKVFIFRIQSALP